MGRILKERLWDVLQETLKKDEELGIASPSVLSGLL